MDTLAIIKHIEIKLSEIGMTKAEFYKKSGISSASFSQWRTGKYKPSEKNLMKAAEVLGVSYSYLVNGSREETNIAPTTDSKSDILDEVDVAFYGDYRELSEDDKATLRDMARIMRERRSKKQE